jgi:hypothetical protein
LSGMSRGTNSTDQLPVSSRVFAGRKDLERRKGGDQDLVESKANTKTTQARAEWSGVTT